MPPSLTSRVQSGVIWNTISVASTYLLGLVRSVIMARFLLAEDFGLFGMALTVVTGLAALSNIGLDISVIRSKFKDDAQLAKHLDTLWTVDLIRRLLLGLLMLALARPAAKFYGEPRVSQLLLVLSVLPLIQGFQNIGLMIYRRGVHFQKIVWLELSTNLLTAVATIALVLWTRNVWALVLSQLVSAFIGVALSYAFHAYRPRLRLDKSSLSIALEFGKYAFVMGVLGYVMSMADNVLIGRLYSAALLGTYVIAYNLAVLPLHGVSNAIVNVTFPAYAEIAGGETKRLERAFVRVFAVSSILLTLTTALLLLLGEEIVVFLYGSKWRAAGTILRILALLVFCKGHAMLVSPLVVSIRGIAPDAKIKLFEAGIFLVVLYPLTTRYGTLGAAWAGAIAFFVMMINRLRVAINLLPDISSTILRTVLSAIAACALGVALGEVLLRSVASISGRLLSGSAVIAVTVTGAMLALSPQLRVELSRLLHSSYLLGPRASRPQ
ncbi:MAG TPA: oligosaccharide flippase family protein [Pyrinomonadaceae bacterium]|nr:oligosaccharide flippase family protein [Pyrinomonadaceae bacterium]